jgi:hypothetical protein
MVIVVNSVQTFERIYAKDQHKSDKMKVVTIKICVQKILTLATVSSCS